MTIFLIAFAVLLIIGVPISISIGASAVLGCLSLGYPLVVIGQKMVSGIDSFLLIAVPLFILAVLPPKVVRTFYTTNRWCFQPVL